MKKLLQMTAGGIAAMIAGAGLVITLTGNDVSHHRVAAPGTTGMPDMSAVHAELEWLRAELASLRNERARAISSAVTGDDSARVLAELQESVAALTRDVASLAMAGSAGVDSVSMGEAAMTNMEQDQLQAEQSRMQHAQRIADIDNYYAAETEYTGWSSTVSDSLRNAFNSEELAGLSLSDASCRETMCRVEVYAGDLMALEQMEMFLPAMVGDELPRATMQQTEHADGSVSAVMYLAREGYSFPVN